MSKRLIWALLLIAVAVVILLFNASGVTKIRLCPGTDPLKLLPAFAFLIWMGLGVLVGVLLK